MQRSLRDWLFEVEAPVERADGWWFAVRGARSWTRGPFATRSDAEHACHQLFRRWGDAARSRGGWAWMHTPRRWVVTAPADCVVHGRPFRSEACTRHHAMPGPQGPRPPTAGSSARAGRG